MPILPKEPDIYPEDLLSDHGAGVGGEWWVIYTLSRREKDFMRRLGGLQVPFYCPLIPKKSRSAGGRVRTSHIPLFPGYVFVQGDDEQRQRCLSTNCVSRTLPVSNGRQLVVDLRQIQRLIEASAPLTQEARIQPGQLVRVISGPLLGLEGTVISRRGVERLLVAVGFLQQGASIAIEDFQVELV